MVYSSKDSESLWFLYLEILNGMLTIEEEMIKFQFISCENYKMDQRTLEHDGLSAIRAFRSTEAQPVASQTSPPAGKRKREVCEK